MSNPLAKYFTNNDNDITGSSNTIDIVGKTFFDLISDCKDLNEKETKNQTKNDAYDIWPLPNNLKQIDTKSNIEEPEFQFSIHEPLIDPIKILVSKHFGTQEAAKRILPNADSVLADANGLQILIKCGCHRSVVNLTYKILKGLSSKSLYTSYSLQVWFIRIAVLMKLKMFKEADLELKQFDNFERPYFFYEFHQGEFPGRKGSIVPFGLRMLNAELNYYLGKSDESLCSLYQLLNTLNQIIKELPNQENFYKIWYERKHKIQFSISNILISKKNYEKGIVILEEIAESNYSDKNAIWSSIGKIFAQIGDLIDASNSFIKAKNFSKKDSVEDNCRNLLNLSLLKIMNNQYNEAYEYLKEANSLAPDNPIVLNNMAFCLFYSGNLKEAIALIEKNINSNPAKNLNESLLFNLCTLYELESSKAMQKKLNLLLWLNVYAGDGFYEPCIQL